MNRNKVAGPRIVVLKILECVLNSGSNLSDAESQNKQAEARDRAFTRHLAYGVLRWLTALEWLATQLLKKPLRRKDRDVHRLILLGLFELWKGDAAAHAAIHENAECARTVGKPWAVSVINAVLRRFQREQTFWVARLENQDERFAHPEWLLQALKADWPEDWQQIVAANNRPGPLWLRLNRLFDTADTVDGLTASGLTLERHPVAVDAVKVSPAGPVNLLPGFDQGRISVQDPAAQLAAELLQLEDYHHVLDACAAPGGKACHILETAPGLTLDALDQSQSRLELVAENLDRLGLRRGNTIKLVAADAAAKTEWWDGVLFDRIMLDAPCSATGVIRRHPEIKWLRNPGQIENAAKFQARLLQRLWPLLKVGGILLYATCSVLRVENSRQIQRFIELHPDSELLETDANWGHKLDYGRQILPGQQEMDGFFYASLRKKS
jgi:16S rRNA (cytosine967-C5)-methyltransferase